MTRKVVLALNINGEACHCFATGPQHDPEKIAQVIEKEAGVHNLDVRAKVIAADWASPETICHFLAECWAEKHATPSLPEPPATLFPPPNAYGQ